MQNDLVLESGENSVMQITIIAFVYYEKYDYVLEALLLKSLNR